MQTNEGDIVNAMLATVRDVLGDGIMLPAVEKAIETKLRLAWGGNDVYVRKLDTEARAREIRTRYNMCNRRELQAEFGISRAYFYKILKGG